MSYNRGTRKRSCCHQTSPGIAIKRESPVWRHLRKQQDTGIRCKGHIMYLVRLLAPTSKKNRKLRVVWENAYSKSREGFAEAVRAIHRAIHNGAALGQILTADGGAAAIEPHDYYDAPSEEEVLHDMAIQLELTRACNDFASLSCRSPGTRH
jgi:hypothetical protein